MKTTISLTPAQEAGTYIREKMAAHAHEPVLLLVSAGSSLSILEHIHPEELGGNITVALADERYTNDNNGSNFASLQKTEFYERALNRGARFIDPQPQVDESHEALAIRIENTLRAYYEMHPKSYTLGIFGIGEDGHTASIFPTTEAEFDILYKPDALYTSITHEKAIFPYRTTITPNFIEEMIDDVVLFAVGSNKCDNILNYMHNRNFARYQIPALIPAQHPQSVLFTDCATLM